MSEGGLGNSEKINFFFGKTVHGVMVSDASPRKNTKHAIPIMINRITLHFPYFPVAGGVKTGVWVLQKDFI
jgi:hypothetical protein